MDHHGLRFLVALGLLLGAGFTEIADVKAGVFSREKTLMVVPARPRIIQLAMDLAQIRPVVVLSYRVIEDRVEPLLFFWKNNEWCYISPDDFLERRFLKEWPRQVIMIGDDQVLPRLLAEEAAWGADLTRFQTLHVADLINGVDAVFHFKASEWQWLAGRYALTLTDLNESRRKYNPYDVPRSKLPLETKEFKQQKDDMPPAVLIESDEGSSAPQAPGTVAPAGKPDARDPSLK